MNISQRFLGRKDLDEIRIKLEVNKITFHNIYFQHDMKDHVTFMGSHKNVGLTIIDFKRSIMPHDSADAPIPMEGPCQVCDSGLDINISSIVEF